MTSLKWKEWLGLSGANPQFSRVWGLPWVDPSHTEKVLKLLLRLLPCILSIWVQNCLTVKSPAHGLPSVGFTVRTFC